MKRIAFGGKGHGVRRLSPDLGRVLVILTDPSLSRFVQALPSIGGLAAYFRRGVEVLTVPEHLPLLAMLPPDARIRPAPQLATADTGLRQTVKALIASQRMLYRRYQAVIDLTGDAGSALLTARTLSSRRIGYSGLPRSWMYSDRMTRDEPLSQCLESIPEAVPLRLQIPELLQASLGTLLTDVFDDPTRPLAVLHAGRPVYSPKWPVQKFSRIADHLVRRWRMNICWVGGDGESRRLEELRREMIWRDHAAYFLQPLDVVAALLDRAKLVVAVKGGVSHLAGMTESPLLTLLHPDDADHTPPSRAERHRVLRIAPHKLVELEPYASTPTATTERMLEAASEVMAETPVTEPEQVLDSVPAPSS